MEILSCIIWILIGIVYIIHRGLKEETETTLSILAVLTLVFLPAVLLLFFAGENPPRWAGVLIIPLWVVEGIIIVKVTDRKNGFFSKKKERKIAENNEIRLQGLMKEFSRAGYEVSENMWSGYSGLRRTVDVVKSEKYAVPLYNRKEDRPSDIHEIYESLSDLEYRALMGVSAEKLCEYIGCDLEDIPLNGNVTDGDIREARVREQYRIAQIKGKRAPTREALTFAQNGWVLWSAEKSNEATRQRNVLLVRYILEKEGLCYPQKRSSEFPKDREYVRSVQNALVEHGQRQSPMTDG